MQPGPPRRIGCRELVAAQVLNGDIRLQASSGNINAVDRNLSRFRFQVVDSARGRGFKLLRECRHTEIAAILVEHPLHEEIAADKYVARHAVTELAESVGDSNRIIDNRHVATLAA